MCYRSSTVTQEQKEAAFVVLMLLPIVVFFSILGVEVLRLMHILTSTGDIYLLGIKI